MTSSAEAGPNRPIIILGAGGHARVVADALLAAGARVLGFIDPDLNLHGRCFCGLDVLGGDEVLAGHTLDNLDLANGIGGVGTNGVSQRERLQRLWGERGWRFAEVRHPSAVVSRFAVLAEGVQLFAQSVVQAGARLGAGCIVNTAAVVEHDVQLGSFVHVAPNAVICGDAKVGDGCHLGAGSVVRQGTILGERTVVGAGAVVVRNFDGGGTLVGMPARRQECTK